MARILVVDDEHNIRLMIGLALRHVGHTVESASDGEEAIEKFGTGAGWDLVLLDQRLPGMQGLDVLARLKQTDPLCRVVVITAFGTVELARQAVQCGALDLLRKPFTTDMLRGVVSAALSEEPGATPPIIAVNGYSVRPGVDYDVGEGHVHLRFQVRTPSGVVAAAAVQIPREVADQARSYAGLGPATTDYEKVRLVYRSIGEELLANYLWQNADLPANGLLRADELTASVRRRLDAVLAGVAPVAAEPTTSGSALAGSELRN